MSAGTNTRLGVLLMVATTLIFSVQDGLSLHLSSTYNVYMVVMVRYWFFAAFVMTVSAKQAGGLTQCGTHQTARNSGLSRGALGRRNLRHGHRLYLAWHGRKPCNFFSLYPHRRGALGAHSRRDSRLAALARNCRRVLWGAGDFRARIRSVLPLCDHPRSRRFHVRTLQPAHAICRPPRQHRNQLLLDRRHGVPVDECHRRVSF